MKVERRRVATYIFVIDKFHEHKLPVCSLGVGYILEWATELFDGHFGVGQSVIGSTETYININIRPKF